uniref:Uncharacterized protein n=1 Tax=Sphaerodactylus townsendi TaxID=933632 RepID=A0ACB8G4R4_9SAUR
MGLSSAPGVEEIEGPGRASALVVKYPAGCSGTSPLLMKLVMIKICHEFFQDAELKLSTTSLKLACCRHPLKSPGLLELKPGQAIVLLHMTHVAVSEDEELLAFFQHPFHW